jgi:tetratricopeptide (TPR) repeat protein
MKKIIISITLLFSICGYSQIQFPKASPQGKIEQRIGVTDITVSYSRPSINGRVIFGNVVPVDKIWRTGANENTIIKTSDDLIFGKDTLKRGVYSIYSKPSKETWELYFYNDTLNWGEPRNWDDSKVALKTQSNVKLLNDSYEFFTIDLQQLNVNNGQLVLAWEKTKVIFPFQVNTRKKVTKSIDKLMAGPTAGEYFNAGSYYFKEKIDLKKALEWVSKAIDMQGEDAYWMLRTKSLILAELGDFKGAIETAKKALIASEKAKNQANIDMNKASIEEWKKK